MGVMDHLWTVHSGGHRAPPATPTPILAPHPSLPGLPIEQEQGEHRREVGG